jgi:hypothetical protein
LRVADNNFLDIKAIGISKSTITDLLVDKQERTVLMFAGFWQVAVAFCSLLIPLHLYAFLSKTSSCKTSLSSEV